MTQFFTANAEAPLLVGGGFCFQLTVGQNSYKFVEDCKAWDFLGFKN